MFKRWRRENPTISKRPKGFILEVIAAEHLNAAETHYGVLFVQMLERIVDRYAYEVSLEFVPTLADPSLPENNILSDISFDAFNGFYNKVKAHAAIGRAALSLDDQDQATKSWPRINRQSDKWNRCLNRG